MEMPHMLISYAYQDILVVTFKVPTTYYLKMFIIPFTYLKSTITSHQINVHRFIILTIGGKQLWTENDSLDPLRDILHPNDIYLEKSPIKYKNYYLCQVDITKTNLNDFYKWEEIELEDKDCFCWRTFYTFGNELDLSSWLPIPKNESIGLDSIFQQIISSTKN
jgi:hypothetical protein